MIKTNLELAKAIKGKRILHLNSLGKDSVLSLEWLVKAAEVQQVVSVHFKYKSAHTGDDAYLDYLVKRFPTVIFVIMENTLELNLVMNGIFQSPLHVVNVLNKCEYTDFSFKKLVREVKAAYNCDYICNGSGKYENFARAIKFHKKGIMIDDVIFPLGMFAKDDIFSSLRKSGLKIHPMYKYTHSTFDQPSWYKMRYGCISNKKYWRKLLDVYPLLVLDRYRMDVLLK